MFFGYPSTVEQAFLFLLFFLPPNDFFFFFQFQPRACTRPRTATVKSTEGGQKVLQKKKKYIYANKKYDFFHMRKNLLVYIMIKCVIL